ncbi:MAG TPA: ATP-binding protein [Gemmatimonadales bacterium]|nr:ATP-binding protein [Gemmatimonadales bacterium]
MRDRAGDRLKHLRRLEPVLIWAAVLAGVTLVLHRSRDDIDQAHVVLTYLLVVLGGAVGGGRGLGFSLAVTSFLFIDFYFQLPYDQLTVDKLLDWVVLLAFLVTAIVVAHLLSKAQAEASEARRRADEVDALSAERERLVAEAEHAKAVREADRLKDVFLTSQSHDLRTPLTTIKALAEDSALRGDENAAIVVAQADRLGRLVGNLLDLSRLKGEAFPVTPEENTAEDLIGAVAREAAPPPGSRVVTRVDTQRPALVGRFDFVQSLRILNNLVDNALRCSGPNAAVELAVERDGRWLVFTVADRGPGIADGDRERIFEPFFRAANARPDVDRAGLGLSIARRLADLQGGSLQYEPRAGGGSRFILFLPAVDVLADS